MNTDRYPPPATPCSRRGSYHANDARNTPTGARSWHPAPRGLPYRGSLPHYHGNSGHPRPFRRSRRPPAWQRTTPVRTGSGNSYASYASYADSSDSHYGYASKPAASPPQPQDDWSGNNGFLDAPRKVPVIVSPTSREKSFTEIMNGAFDLKKSPRGLGRRLAAVAPYPMKKEPTDTAFGDEASGFDDWLTPTKRSKRIASSQMGPSWGKQVKTSPHASDRRVADPLFRPMEPFPPANESRSITVGFSRPGQTRAGRPPELARLLSLVRENTEQSQRLAGLVKDYLDRHSPAGQEVAPILGQLASNPFKEIPSKLQTEPVAQVPAIAYGGDGPDPPRDYLNVFRGHMVDQVEVNCKSAQDTPTGSNCGGQGVFVLRGVH
jgi:hypothetical protein